MTQPHDAPRRGTALPCPSAADQPDSNHQAQLTSLVPALHRCAPGPQDQPDPSNSSLSSPLYCIRLIRTLKYLLTKSYRYVIFRFAERESRMCVSRPSHCHRKSLKSLALLHSSSRFPIHALPQPFCFQALTHSLFHAICNSLIPNDLRTLPKNTGVYLPSSQNGTRLFAFHAVASLHFPGSTSRRIQICLYLGSLLSFRLSFDQEGPL
jgi:hypothetical protein